MIPPTCTEHGHSVFVCPDCDASYIDEIVESTNHNYGETVIPATCTTLGYSIFKCSDCGDEYTGNYVGKLAHDDEATVFHHHAQVSVIHTTSAKTVIMSLKATILNPPDIIPQTGLQIPLQLFRMPVPSTLNA